MQGHLFYAGSGDGDRELFGLRWIPNGSPEDPGIKMGLSRALRRPRVTTMRDRKARM
jgi:hypothetical protein